MNDPKSRPWIDSVDLSIRARRGCLPESERRAFEEALEASTTLGAAHQVGCDFDRVAAVRAGDEALIARLAHATVAASEKPRAAHAGATSPVRARRHRVLLFAIAVTLVLGGSAAAWWGRGLSRPGLARAELGVETEATKRTAVAETIAAASATPAPSCTPIAVEGSAFDSPAVPSKVELAPHAASSAATLFRDGNAARHTGDFARARALYLRLEREFPGSDEAGLAHVSLGELLLTSGHPEDAERQFDSYFGGGQALAEEALVGRAQSFARLHRDVDERRIWERLLHDYPSSVYAANARARLAVLSRAEP